MVVIFCHKGGLIIHPRIIHTKTGTNINKMLGGRIIILLMMMVEVVLVLGQPTSPPEMIFLRDEGMVWCLVHPIVSTHNT